MLQILVNISLKKFCWKKRHEANIKKKKIKRKKEMIRKKEKKEDENKVSLGSHKKIFKSQ
jgi:hypothetical protein